MMTTTVNLMNGPKHGQYETVEGIPPTHLRYFALRVLEDEDPRAQLPEYDVPVIAVYRRGESVAAPKPLHGRIGVYWFERYEEISSE